MCHNKVDFAVDYVIRIQCLLERISASFLYTRVKVVSPFIKLQESGISVHNLLKIQEIGDHTTLLLTDTFFFFYFDCALKMFTHSLSYESTNYRWQDKGRNGARSICNAHQNSCVIRGQIVLITKMTNEYSTTDYYAQS